MNAAATKERALDIGGVDLTTVRKLADQLDALDEALAAGEVDTYVDAWLEVSDENGEGCSVYWDSKDHPEHSGAIIRWTALDDQRAARRLRFDATLEHSSGVDGFRPALLRLLISRGRYSDNRHATPREIKAVVRAFLSTGGQLLLAPDGARALREPVEVKPDIKRFMGLDGVWSDLDDRAARAMMRIAQRHRAHPFLIRIVRTLGTPTSNGWHVLGAKK